MKSFQKKRNAQITNRIVACTFSLFICGTPLYGQDSIVSSVSPSNPLPGPGDTISVAINFDMSGASELLGSFTARLNWDAAVLTYLSNSGLMSGFTGQLNINDVENGALAFNGANIQGASGQFAVVEINFAVTGLLNSSTTLDLHYSALAAALTFENLIPFLTINNATVNVTNVQGRAHAALTVADNVVTVGESFAPSVEIDMSGVNVPDNLLGSFSGSLAWDPDILEFISSSDILGGFSGAIDTENADSGTLSFNGENAAGAGGKLGVLLLTFAVVSGQTAIATLNLEFSEMSAAVTFANLLPVLTVNAGEIEINNPPGSFNLLEPADASVVDTLNPTLFWEEATDPDPGDEVGYELIISTSEGFADTLMHTEKTETSHTIEGGLEPGQAYYWKVVAFDLFGGETESSPFSFQTSDMATTVDNDISGVPAQFQLFQNFPNPFNPETRIGFELPRISHVRLDVFNLKGQHIRTLLNEEKGAGSHSVIWNGLLSDGERAPSGLYIYRIKTTSFAQSRKMLMLK